MNTPALELSSLTKTYANSFTALKGIDLTIEQGDFFALLGSNGAGKTTTINIISGLLPKTSGSVIAHGIDQNQDMNGVKRLIGLMPQEFNFNPFEPIVEILVNQAGYYGINRTTAMNRAEYLLERMELLDKKKNMAKTLSGGMKRRLMLARALMHEPKILILDEPSAGVDVEIRLALWEFLKELNSTGTTIILTTHYLEEAEKLCKNIAMIDAGEVVVNTSMSQLLAQVDSRVITLEVDTTPSEGVLNDAYTILSDNTLKVSLTKKQSISEIITELAKHGVIVKDIGSMDNRLEQLFMNFNTLEA